MKPKTNFPFRVVGNYAKAFECDGCGKAYDSKREQTHPCRNGKLPRQAKKSTPMPEEEQSVPSADEEQSIPSADDE